MTDGVNPTDSSTRSFYDADSATYDEQRWKSKGGAFTNRAQQAILHALCGEWRQQRVLEVGPGTARFTIPLLRQGNRMTLLDVSTGMLAASRSNIDALGLGDGVDSFVEGSVYELPFEENSFDHALSLNVLNHLRRPGEALKQMARVIRPGSTLLFNYANLHSYYWPAARRINRRKMAIGQDVYSTWERPAEMRAFIREAGLRLVRQLGHVHVPRALEKYPVHVAVSVLDVLSRDGPLQRLAPFQFCLCRKMD